MTPKASNERRRIGRPPAGARDGEKVKDYPQLSIRLPSEVESKAAGAQPDRRAPAVAHRH